MSWSFLDDHVPKYKSHDAESAMLSHADPQKRDEYKKINRLCHFWEKISYFQKFHHGSNSRDFKKIGILACSIQIYFITVSSIQKPKSKDTKID